MSFADGKLVAKRSAIFVTFEREGIHCFPAAGAEPSLQDVSFLQYPHRHIFKFRVQIDVTHNDRDIEFIQFKRWLENLYDQQTLQLDYMSCEMIAEQLFTKIAEKYPNRDVQIIVSEDGENGAVIDWHYPTIE